MREEAERTVPGGSPHGLLAGSHQVLPATVVEKHHAVATRNLGGVHRR